MCRLNDCLKSCKGKGGEPQETSEGIFILLVTGVPERVASITHKYENLFATIQMLAGVVSVFCSALDDLMGMSSHTSRPQLIHSHVFMTIKFISTSYIFQLIHPLPW